MDIQKSQEELKPLQQTASDYAMHAADASKKILHPVGEWNTTKIVFTPEKVEHWLNGQMVLSFVPWSEDWYERKNSDKWKNSEDYGKYKTGYIGLQDHSSPISVSQYQNQKTIDRISEMSLEPHVDRKVILDELLLA
ncbi:DUF1080 domain-containing protein [Maribacter litopenaei]|uniref:DUF1080 domain-containing protein n=1 Tax=Maribacter litopenaei TaxID=2976127 RepID=A0ABY5YAC9_9FLAO|nr:DUF1080 domain-containing protein [Maribacter litopenaei]UWX55987.1 DUF1080 domain-containing protein [Maribacter litopenaei]